MSETSTGKVLELPFVVVNNAEAIAEHIHNDRQAVIHRHANMDDGYAIEVTAQQKIAQEVSYLCLNGNFMFPASTNPAAIRELQHNYLNNIRAFDLGRHGISAAYTSGDKKALRLGLDDGSTSATTWYPRNNEPPYLFHISNDRRDGRESRPSSRPPKLEAESMESDITAYMRLLSIVDRALGGSSSEYRVDFVEHRSISRRAAMRHAKKDKLEKAQEKAQQKARSQAESEIAKLGEAYKPQLTDPNARLNQVHGIDPQSRSKLQERVLAIKHPDLAKQWGVESSGGILVYGPAGTGKTMAATAIANEVGGHLWQIFGSEIVSKWVGETTQKTKELFDNAIKAAKLGPLVILINEIESVFTNEQNQSTERTAALGELKQHLEYIASQEPNILLIGTTNHMEKIDKAIMRPGRFDIHVYMPLPDQQARLGILLDHISLEEAQNERMFDTTSNIDFPKLVQATEGLSGAEIAHVIKDCRFKKFREHADSNAHPGPITQQDILEQITEFLQQSNEF